MRRHVKASSAGSIVPSGKGRLWSLLAALALALCALGSGASSAGAAAPTVVKVDDASEVGYTTAKVSGEVEPDPALETDCRFEYIPVADFGSRNEVQRLTVTGEAGNYRLIYAPPGGAMPEPPDSIPYNASAAAVRLVLEEFPQIGPEDVTVSGGPGNPTGSTPYLITFTGELANKNIPQMVTYDETDLSTEFTTVTQGHAEGWEDATRVPCEPEGPLTGKTTVSANLSGLSSSPTGTEYRLRLVAENQDGSDVKEASTFTTKAVNTPAVSIEPVTTFTATTAHFVGHVTPGGTDPAFAADWHFECTPKCPGLSGGDISADESSHKVEVDATGLEPNINYEVKLVAGNAGGSSSAQTSFKTIAVGPEALTMPAFILEGGESALVGGRINAHNSATTWWIEYGTTSAYGQNLPASKEASAGSEGGLKFQTQELPGLELDTEYHFRVSAKNAQGEVHGEDVTFKTPPPPGPPATCPNEAFRNGPSAALPDCRAYENVTPMNLLGTEVRSTPVFGQDDVGATAEDGESVLWATTANLPGDDASGNITNYLAQRTPSGWRSSIAVPGHLTPKETAFLVFATPTLERTIWFVHDGLNPEDPDPTNSPAIDRFIRTEADGSQSWLSQGSQTPPNPGFPIFRGASPDGLTVFFESPDQLTSDPSGGVYMRSGLTTTLLKDENGNPAGGQVNAISADGSIFAYDNSNGVYLYEKSVGHAVLVVGRYIYSTPSVVGLSSNGSKLVLATNEPLTPDDEDTARDIYEYNVGTGEFTRLSGTSAGPGNGNADANGFLMTSDGSAVYFTSNEQLDENNGISGVQNIYRAEGGAIHYVSTLPHNLQLKIETATSEYKNPRLTRDGKKLIFESKDRLTAYDNNGFREVYVYASGTGRLTCASCRPSGVLPTGDSALDGSLLSVTSGSVSSADRHGERIFFRSFDGIISRDENKNKLDVYEFDFASNKTSLISTGEGPGQSYIIGNSVDGRDVFFVSLDSLTPNDRNVGTPKLYDARIGGGFAEPPPPAVCEGEGCRAAGSTKPANVAPTTSSFSGPGNPKPKAKKHKKRKHKSHKKTQQRKSHKRAANANGRTGR